MAESIVGKVQTVLGPIDPEQMGVTLTHEHLLIDLSVTLGPPENASGKDFFHKPVSQDMLGAIRYYGRPNADNARLFDVPTAIEEAMLYKQYGK